MIMPLDVPNHENAVEAARLFVSLKSRVCRDVQYGVRQDMADILSSLDRTLMKAASTLVEINLSSEISSDLPDHFSPEHLQERLGSELFKGVMIGLKSDIEKINSEAKSTILSQVARDLDKIVSHLNNERQIG